MSDITPEQAMSDREQIMCRVKPIAEIGDFVRLLDMKFNQPTCRHGKPLASIEPCQYCKECT